MLGGLLVATAAVVVFAAALSAAGGGRAAYVVATRSLPAGSVIGPDDLTTARMSLSGATAAASFRDGPALIGRTLAVGAGPGQLIESSMLAAGGPSDLRPVSLAVDADSVTALAAGEPVDVLATSGSGGSGAVGGASVVLRGATLLSVGRSDSGLLSGATGSTVVVTIGVSDLAEAEALVSAAHAGTVELIRAEPGDGAGIGSGPAGQG